MARPKKIKVSYTGIHDFGVAGYKDAERHVEIARCNDCELEGTHDLDESFVIVECKNKQEVEDVSVCKGNKKVEVLESKEKLYLKYTFTEEEIHGLSKKLAGENMKLEKVEDEKKSIVSDFASQINNIKKSISILSQQVNAGHEYRYVDCVIKFHDPEKDKKTITRVDSGEIVEILDMVEEDYTLFNQEK